MTSRRSLRTKVKRQNRLKGNIHHNKNKCYFPPFIAFGVEFSFREYTSSTIIGIRPRPRPRRQEWRMCWMGGEWNLNKWIIIIDYRDVLSHIRKWADNNNERHVPSKRFAKYISTPGEMTRSSKLATYVACQGLIALVPGAHIIYHSALLWLLQWTCCCCCCCCYSGAVEWERL